MKSICLFAILYFVSCSNQSPSTTTELVARWGGLGYKAPCQTKNYYYHTTKECTLKERTVTETSTKTVGNYKVKYTKTETETTTKTKTVTACNSKYHPTSTKTVYSVSTKDCIIDPRRTRVKIVPKTVPGDDWEWS